MGALQTPPMGFGDTAKKIQKLSTVAEDLYEKMNQVFAQLQQVRERVESTTERVEAIERDLDEQRMLLEAIAAEQGLDPDQLIQEHRDRIADQASNEDGPTADDTTDSDSTRTDGDAGESEAGGPASDSATAE